MSSKSRLGWSTFLVKLKLKFIQVLFKNHNDSKLLGKKLQKSSLGIITKFNFNFF